MKVLLASALLAIALPAAAAPVFRNPVPAAHGTTTYSHLLRADFDGDQHDDLMVVGERIAVLLANGTGPFAARVDTPLGSQFARPAVGDVNGDAGSTSSRDTTLPRGSP